MTHRSTALRRTTRAATAIAVSGSFLFAGTAAAEAAGSVDLPSFGSLGRSARRLRRRWRLLGSRPSTTSATSRAPATRPLSATCAPACSIARTRSRRRRDLATLDGLKLSAVYTCGRTRKWRRRPTGSRRTRVRPHPDLSGDLAAGVAQLRTPDDADASCRTEPLVRYRSGRARRLRATAHGLGEHPRTAGLPLHRRQGPDRLDLGTTAEHRRGFRADIMSDYLLTNEYTAASMERTYEGIKASRGRPSRTSIAPCSVWTPAICRRASTSSRRSTAVCRTICSTVSTCRR